MEFFFFLLFEKEVGWMSDLFSRLLSGENGQIQFNNIADKTGHDSNVYRISLISPRAD